MLRATLKSLLARKLRLLLSGTAIVLGVSFVSGALVLTDTLGRVFDDLFVSVNEKTDVEIIGAQAFDSDFAQNRTPVPQSVADAVRDVPGVVAVSGDVQGFAQLIGRDGDAYQTGGAPLFGFNYDNDPAISPYTLRSGAAPQGPNEIALDAATAEATGFVPGDRTSVLLQGGPREVTVSGVFGFGDNENAGGASILAFDPAVAQELLAVPGEFYAVRVAGADGVDPGELRDRVAGVVPAGFEVVTGEQSAERQASEIKEALGFVSTFLLVFAGVALFVGAFLIVNTFSMLIAQRTRELALLRALGASRGQVTRSVLVEALIVGVVASIVGLGLGLAVAIGLQELISAFGGSLPTGPLVVSVSTVVVSLVVGVVVTLLAALLPARRASAVAPVEALREAAAPDPSLRRTTIGGAVLLAVGAAGLAVGLAGNLPMLGVGAFLIFVGVALLSPLISRPVSRLVGAPVARGPAGKLGRLNAMRNPRRTATTAAALMVGLALVSAVSVLGASLTRSVEVVVADGLDTDLVVQSTSFQGLPPTLGEQLRAAAGIGVAEPVRQDQALVGGSTPFVSAVNPSSLGDQLQLRQRAGDVSALAPDTILLSESQAGDLGVSVGDAIPVTLSRGDERDLRLVGTYADNEFIGGVLLHNDLGADFATPLDFALLVNAASGTDLAQLRTAVEQVTVAYPGTEVLSQEQLVEDVAGQVDTIVSIITVLLVLSVLIALLGIVNTLALSVVERTRELGLLRAIGLSRRQTRRMVRVEAVLVAVFGALLGLAVGAALGVAFQRALIDDGITELAFPALRLVLLVVGAALAGVLAAILPARRAARLNGLEAIATP